eukprot:2928200-Pyramimonas_sp.AAC.1
MSALASSSSTTAPTTVQLSHAAPPPTECDWSTIARTRPFRLQAIIHIMLCFACPHSCCSSEFSSSVRSSVVNCHCLGGGLPKFLTTA